MFCKYCGNQLPEDANFCPKCGRIIKEENQSADNTTNYSDTQRNNSYNTYTNNSYEQPEPIRFDEDPVEAAKDDSAGSILKFSIMGLAFSFFLPILGLIFTIIAKVKVKNHIEKYGDTEGRATVGKHLTIPGMICSIFFTVLWFIYFILIFAILLQI